MDVKLKQKSRTIVAYLRSDDTLVLPLNLKAYGGFVVIKRGEVVQEHLQWFGSHDTLSTPVYEGDEVTITF